MKYIYSNVSEAVACAGNTSQHVMHRKLKYACATLCTGCVCLCVCVRLHVMRHWLGWEIASESIVSCDVMLIIFQVFFFTLFYFFVCLLTGLSKSYKLTLGRQAGRQALGLQRSYNFTTLCGTGVKNLTCILLQQLPLPALPLKPLAIHPASRQDITMCDIFPSYLSLSHTLSLSLSSRSLKESAAFFKCQTALLSRLALCITLLYTLCVLRNATFT